MSEIAKAKMADLSNAEPRNWFEISRFAIMGFFLGSILWIVGLGIHQLLLLIVTVLRSIATSIGYVLPDALVSTESAMAFETWAIGIEQGFAGFFNLLVDLLDKSDFLLPVLVALAFAYWRYRYQGRRGVWMTMVQSLFRNRSAAIGLIVIGLFGLIANFAQFLSPFDPIETLIGRPRTAPCYDADGVDDEGNPACTAGQFIMGTDPNGRDLYSRVIWGSRISIPIGVIAVTISIFFGVIVGLATGYFGGWFDNVIMRIMDVLLAFPSLLLAIAIVTVLGPGLQNALVAISIVAMPTYARLMRASVLSLKEQEFVLAERALGAGDWRIMFEQILPNALTPIVVQGTLGVGTAVLEASALSFLGLGAQPPAAEWGQMLSESFQYFNSSPYLVFYPGICIMIIVLGFNLLGDGLRDALDPRLNKN